MLLPRRIKRLFSHGLVSFFALTIFSTYAFADAGSVVLLKKKGAVAYQQEGGKSEGASEGDRITEGFTVTTGKGSSVVLLFSNGTTLRLAEGSILHITEFEQEAFKINSDAFKTLEAEPTASVVTLKLDKGELISEAKAPNREEGSSFEISTPVGTADIRGASFIIKVEQLTGGEVEALCGVTKGHMLLLPIGQDAMELFGDNQVRTSLRRNAQGQLRMDISGVEVLSPAKMATIKSLNRQSSSAMSDHLDNNPDTFTFSGRKKKWTFGRKKATTGTSATATPFSQDEEPEDLPLIFFPQPDPRPITPLEGQQG